MATAERWPNGIGWDIGDSEVRDLMTRLRAFVPVQPRHELRNVRVSCFATAERLVEIPQHRVMDFPLGTDPVWAVGRTREAGQLREDACGVCYPAPPMECGQLALELP